MSATNIRNWNAQLSFLDGTASRWHGVSRGSVTYRRGIDRVTAHYGHRRRQPAGPTGTTHGPHGEQNPRRHRGGDEVLVHGLRHERDRLPRSTRRARRAQAGAPADSLYAAFDEQRLEPVVHQVRPRCRRRIGEIPPTWGYRRVRRPRPFGAG